MDSSKADRGAPPQARHTQAVPAGQARPRQSASTPAPARRAAAGDPSSAGAM